MREVLRGLRRFWIVTVGVAVRPLNLLGVAPGYPRPLTGIEAAARNPSLIERGRGPPRSGGRVRGYTLSERSTARMSSDTPPGSVSTRALGNRTTT